jgi:hypothetical protein
VRGVRLPRAVRSGNVVIEGSPLLTMAGRHL